MKKLSALCFALAVFFYTTAAYSRICFLGDTDCQAGIFKATDNVPCSSQNSSWIHESDMCRGLEYGSPVCNDSTGNYYAESYCPSGYTDISEIDDSKYVCGGSLLCNKCCANEDIMCSPSKYSICSNNSTGVIGGEDSMCEDKEGIKHTRCQCDKSVYPTQCTGAGLTGDYSSSCTDDSGQIWFKTCSCKSGWMRASSADIKCSAECDGHCSLGEQTLIPGTLEYCWTGSECKYDPNDPDNPNYEEDEEVCLVVYQSDFDKFWGGYDVNGKCNNLTVDCASLGYTTGTAGTGVKCADGTEPYRCPFDHSIVYCEFNIEGACDFITKEDCELNYFGSVCERGADKCFKPSACKTNYSKNADSCANGVAGKWTLGESDNYGCAICQCETTCADTLRILPANADPVYEKCSACNETVDIMVDFTCKAGYIKSDDGTTCVEDCGDEFKLDKCPTNSLCEQCLSGKKLKYKAIGCKDGFAKTSLGCGLFGANAWTIGTKDDNGCGACVPYDCGSDYSATATCPSNYYGQKQTQLCLTCYSGQDIMMKVYKDCFDAGYEYDCGSYCSNTNETGIYGETRCTSNPNDYDIGGIVTPGTGGGGAPCANVCNPPNQNSCECKKCQRPNYCINGPGAGGMDPTCCQMNESEDSVNTNPSIYR